MQVSKIIISITIAVLLIGAGVGLWVYMRLGVQVPATSQQNSNLPSNYPDNSSQTTVVPSSSNTPTQVTETPTTADPDHEYDILFGKIAVTRLKFNTATSTKGQNGELYALYAADIASSKKMFPKATEFPIDVAKVDLNGDGIAEAVVYENLPGYCGTAGCPFEIYKKNGSGWSLIFSKLAYEPSAISSSKSEGYSDLVLSVHGDLGYVGQVLWFTWDGKTYQQQNLIALWDGLEFDLLQ